MRISYSQALPTASLRLWVTDIMICSFLRNLLSAQCPTTQVGIQVLHGTELSDSGNTI